jgi:hypothetical protein
MVMGPRLAAMALAVAAMAAMGLALTAASDTRTTAGGQDVLVA